MRDRERSGGEKKKKKKRDFKGIVPGKAVQTDGDRLVDPRFASITRARVRACLFLPSLSIFFQTNGPMVGYGYVTFHVCVVERK